MGHRESQALHSCCCSVSVAPIPALQSSRPQEDLSKVRWHLALHHHWHSKALDATTEPKHSVPAAANILTPKGYALRLEPFLQQEPP